MGKKLLTKEKLHIFVYPFVCANIIVTLLVLVFQLLLQKPIVFSLCSAVTYIAMFFFIIKKQQTVEGKKPTKRTTLFLLILTILLSLSIISQVIMHSFSGN
ncbi:hypothetical protein [Sedimentisphaera salicampi]|uniref:hypothetical protein n=1 Tax=Sedimentisphaera salicampi TaxID=1941349 RepID=UPI000B9C1AA4|nr:hypothetical protein [Sedimentisphaera salicampi]